MSVQGQSLICLSTVDWDFLWGRHQELMSRLAQDGYQVLYLEPLGIRSPRPADLPRIIKRVNRRLGAGPQGVRLIAENLYLFSPLALPFHGWAIVDAMNRLLLIRSIKGLMRKLGMAKPILWTFFATQAVLDMVDGIEHELLIYDCIDAVALNPKGVARNYAQTEAQLVQKADLVFASSVALYEARKAYNEHVYHIPPGVNIDRFAQVGPAPSDLVAIPQPRVCFFGGIDERLDLGLMASLARAHPEWAIVLIGRIRTDVSSLGGVRNIFFLGQKPHRDLPLYLHNTDVLIVPYVVDAYTVHIHPNKIYECLATRKPTVATHLPSLAGLSDVISLASTEEEFIAGIEQALVEDDEALRRRRLEIAAANSWEARYKEIKCRIAQRHKEMRTR